MHALVLMLLATQKVDRVVVYPDRAQVFRVAEVACSGDVTVTFAGVPPSADPTSFRARAEGGEVEGLLAEERAREEKFAPELKGLDAQIQSLERELAAVDDARAAADALARLGGEYADAAKSLVSAEMMEPKPDLKAWAAALDLALKARLDAAAAAAEAQKKTRVIRHQLDELQQKRGRLAQASARKEHVAQIYVRCRAEKARVELAYLVGGASWEPAYEARADEAASAVELKTFATVRQSTGEDWKGAHLTLSTAIPSQDATPPELSPLEVYAHKREPEKKVLVRREERIEHAQAGQAGQTDGAGLAAHAQGLPVQLDVPERADVPGNGEPVRLFVGRSRMKARLSWRTAPKAVPFVFRVADLTNAAPYPLLGGPIDTYRGNAFTGRTHLERVPEGGAFHLTFGIDDAVRVRRTVLEEVQREAGLFGGKRRFKYGYRFELASYATKPREVELAEHVPVSELEDVRVEIQPSTTKGYALGRDDGIATWKVSLAPQEKRAVELRFFVEVPSSYDTGACDRRLAS